LGSVAFFTEHVSLLLAAGVLPAFRGVLNRSGMDSECRKCIMWVLSNITADRTEHIQAVIDSGIVSDVLAVGLRGADPQVQKEALWALANASSGATSDQKQWLLDLGAMEAICEQLGARDNRVVGIALEAIENFLLHGEDGKVDGVNPVARQLKQCQHHYDQLLQLQNHASEAIYHAVLRIIEQFFET
jgi:importin subunit alpha-1